MPLKAAIFCSQGLGDGLIFFIVANNLQANGFEVVAYHDFLSQMQPFFPFSIQPFPPTKSIKKTVLENDLIIINSNSTEKSKLVVDLAKKYQPGKSWVLHATTCKGKNLPGDFYLNPTLTMAENLKIFCQSALHLKTAIKENGFACPVNNQKFQNLKFRKYKNRIVFHPSSTNVKKNWPLKKFLKLAEILKTQKYDVFFILKAQEKPFFISEIIKNGFQAPCFQNLKEMVCFLYESAFCIGNDSGIGHLASNLGLPVVTIFADSRKKIFWRPDWSLVTIAAPFSFLPNIKYLRLKEKYWDKMVPVFKVFNSFKQLEKMAEQL